MKFTTTILLFIIQQIYLACPNISISSTSVSCYLGSDGSATITVSGPNGPFNATWSTGQVNSNIPNGTSVVANFLPAGIYNVYVVDQLGCSSVNVVVVSEPNIVSSAIASSDVLCNGDNTGAINLSPFGGTGNYTFSWSNGEISEDVSNLIAGNYSVNITDQNGCSSGQISTTINEPSSAINSNISASPISCSNGLDGSIVLNAYGGTPPYAYNWNGGTYFTKDITNLSSGNYTVLITDNNGCTNSNSLTLNDPTPIAGSLATNSIDCFGESTGNIDLSVSGGTSPYTYQWSNSTSIISNAQDLYNVIADEYNVLIKDANNCSKTESTQITQSAIQQLSITSNDVSCNGYSDGNITLLAQGGSPPYSYSWNGNTSLTGNLTNIIAGNYDLVLTDDKNCITTASVAITEPSSEIIISGVTTDVLCNGNNTGSVDLSISGGTPPYAISWDNNASSEDISNLFAGDYGVTIIDDNNCIGNSSYSIIEPDQSLSNLFSVLNVDCFGSSTGAIQTTVAGGTPPYFFSWSNSSFSLSPITSSLFNLNADDYFLELTDNNGCILNDTTNVSQPDVLSTSLIGTNILCFGDLSGDIDLSVSGGTQPYNYLWSNGASSPDIQFLAADNYIINITDFNNCSTEDSIELTQPLMQLNSYYYLTQPSCFGGSNGEINYHINGGTPPYTYAWNNNQTVSNLVGLSAGTYVIDTYDDNNCTIKDTILLNQPTEITLTASVDSVTCFEDQNGAIQLSVSGGTPIYSYEWSNSTYVLSQTTSSISNLQGDTYIVIVTDINNCENSGSYFVYEPAELIGELDIKQITCPGANDGEINTLISGGNSGTYSYSWSNGETTPIISNLSPNIYAVTISDRKGCKIDFDATIVEPIPISIGGIVTEVTCRDQKDGTILVNATGGAGDFSYEWDHGEDTDFIQNLLGGEYTVTATDALNCSSEQTFFVPTNVMACINPPTVFTPNGDGINDTWFLLNIELYPDAVINVMDMWGKYVFQSNGYATPWNGGKNNEKPLPMGTYYYIIHLDNYGTTLTGPITILK